MHDNLQKVGRWCFFVQEVIVNCVNKRFMINYWSLLRVFSLREAIFEVVLF